MNLKEFKYWLEGYLVGMQIKEEEINRVMDKLNKVIEPPLPPLNDIFNPVEDKKIVPLEWKDGFKYRPNEIICKSPDI